ncbi:hypothetical protein SDRG_03916 [Saprolegnia diclina VS20]|uniref:Clathrin light chain n=1 Tax=Saprolegnia diclina (strain VS20) TaxID=1156394 RepID=T0QWD7_SAPDV|nr:hypothetical protein SDRG_03916 [Saprolegnia diclina VS20]EQC38961.1 hypothetical protein SDRG_03916 [Saprolegnia diclina VS20]|eukprot:XP_008607785.1 hypothetical protein SDRG_03916 [Saprolegnia diclina VS20]
MPFTASDGTEFEDRDEWRKYEFATNFTFKAKKDETLMKLPGQIAGQPFDIADLEGCQVLLLDHCDQVQIDNLVNCRVFIGPSSESVFVRNCTNCVFTVACKQLRTRDCSQCHLFLYSLTDPIIETSTQMVFAPFNGAYHGLRSHFASANLEPENNHWANVYDFNDPDKTGENWRLVQDAVEPWVIPLEQLVADAEAFGPCENPVPANATPITHAEDPSLQSFSIDTSQQDAQAHIEAVAESTQHDESVDGFVPSSDDSAQFYDEAPSPPSSTFNDPPPAPIESQPVPVEGYSSKPGAYSSQPKAAAYTSQPKAAAYTSQPKAEAYSSQPKDGGFTSMPDPQQNWPMLDEFEQKQAAEVEEKRVKEEALIKEVRAKAEEDLDKYYGDRTDKLAHRAATNREHEEQKKQTQAALAAASSEQPWNRVTDLVDMSAPAKIKTDAEKKKKDDVDLLDTTRMRSLLVQLKNTGGPETIRAQG